jgi:hypothetical protein
MRLKIHFLFARATSVQSTVTHQVQVAFSEIFLTEIVKSLGSVRVDLARLKPFERHWGSKGYFYMVSYDISLVFGPEITMKFVQNGRVVGSAVCNYE